MRLPKATILALSGWSVQVRFFSSPGTLGTCCGIETRADDVDDAGELEIVADDLGEELGVRASGVFARDEVRHGEARLRDVAEAGAGLEPRWVLGASRACAIASKMRERSKRQSRVLFRESREPPVEF